MHTNEASTGRVLISFIGGLAAGFGLALLFAPRAGHETREALTNYARSTGETLSSLARNAVDAARQATESGTEKLASVTKRGQARAEETASSLSSELEH
jgi:gas vesicle protein